MYIYGRYPVMEYVKPANRIVINTLPFLTSAAWYQNENLYSDLHIKWVDEIFREFSVQKYKAAIYKTCKPRSSPNSEPRNELGTSPTAPVY